MADDNLNSRHPTDEVGEVSTKNQSALEDRLADLKQLLETNLVLSGAEPAHREAHEGAFPNHPPSDTFKESLGFNNLVDNIWNLQREQERQFDPLLYLGDDVMHEVLAYVVSLWDISESRAWSTEVIPKNSVGDPLVLMNVSRRWSQFITSYPPLWSYLLIDTDDNDVMEYLQLFFLLSRNKRLFIILHGSGDVRDDIVRDLQRVGDRIDTLLYRPNVSHTTLEQYRRHLGASHSQLQHVCPWYKLGVQSAIQSQQDIYHYSFPTSIQSLWMDGLFPLSKLVALSHFQSLSSLSVRISVDSGNPLAHNYRLELPNLEVFRVQMTMACHRQVETPIFISFRKLKLLDLRYVLEFSLESPQNEPATWMEFDIVDGIEEMQLELAINVVPKVRLTARLVEWLKMRRILRQLEQEQRRLAQEEMEELEKEELRGLLLELQRLKRFQGSSELQKLQRQWEQREQREQWQQRKQLEQLKHLEHLKKKELPLKKELRLLPLKKELMLLQLQSWDHWYQWYQWEQWEQRQRQQQRLLWGVQRELRELLQDLLQDQQDQRMQQDQLEQWLQREQQVQQVQQEQQEQQEQSEQWEQREQWEQWEQQEQQAQQAHQAQRELEQQLEQRELEQLEQLIQRGEQQREQWEQQREQWEQRERKEREQREHWERRMQEIQWKESHLHFMMSIRAHWLKWLNLPDYLEHVQQSSLKVTLSRQMHKEVCGAIRNELEGVLVRRLPRLTELTTSNIFHIFPKHLRKLRFHGFARSGSWPSMTFPSLVSLEIIADSPNHLLVMKYIQVPQLRVLRVQVDNNGPGTLHMHDWGANISNTLDHISLRIEIPRGMQGNIRFLDFKLPQTHSLDVFSLCTPLRLCLAKPTPTIYTLNAGLVTMSRPSRSQVFWSTMWNEELVTEWIIPYSIPSLVKFETLTSLQRIVLDQLPYILSEPSPTDTLFNLLKQSIHACPQLTSITLSQCPSIWSRFLCQLRTRNREAMLSRRTKCIDELGFHQPLHVTIIRWLVDAIKARVLDVKERPPIREGNAWPTRPFEAEDAAFRSCYICHITGMELGCYESETQTADCGRQRGDGSKILVS